MKKLVIIGVLVVSPLTSFAFDALTPIEDAYSLLPNSNFLLKEEYKKNCETEPLVIEKEMASVIEQYSGYQEKQKLEPLYVRQRDAARECDAVKAKITNQVAPTIEQNRLFGCGPGLIKRGGKCITPTAACQMYFGQNVVGVKSTTDPDVAECTCSKATFVSGLCVAPTSASNPASAVLGVSTVQTNAQLKEVIAQLLSQVQILIAQVNAMGR